MWRLSPWLSRPSVLKALWQDARLGGRLLREPRVSWWAKSTLPLALLYLVSPIDVLPEVIPVLGELDDLLVLYGALKLLIFLTPRAVAAFHRGAMETGRPFATMPPGGEVIDAEFRRG